MSDLPQELYYLASHEWAEVDGMVATIGVSNHAQELLGDLVFVELPEVGEVLSAGDDVAVVESVKAASDVFTPLSGEVIEVNEDLEDSPALINTSPYADGWLVKIRIKDLEELKDLLDAAAYSELLEEE